VNKLMDLLQGAPVTDKLTPPEERRSPADSVLREKILVQLQRSTLASNHPTDIYLLVDDDEINQIPSKPTLFHVLCKLFLMLYSAQHHRHVSEEQGCRL